jgi:hypothetical protein
LLGLLVGYGSINRHNYDIELDGSKSIDESSFKKYVNIIVDDILPSMGMYDCISIKFIDECSLTKAERVFTLDLAKKNFSNQHDGLNFADDSAKVRMNRFIKDTVSISLRNLLQQKRNERSNCAGYTNIIDALNQSASLLKNDKSFSSNLGQLANDAVGKDNYEYENIIIVFSDMINENREQSMNFTEFGTYNQQQVVKKLTKIKNEGKLPNLNKAKVIVYGATSSGRNYRYADSQIENIKLFWQNFFKESDARLLAYGYDTEKEILDYMTEQNQQ